MAKKKVKKKVTRKKVARKKAQATPPGAKITARDKQTLSNLKDLADKVVSSAKRLKDPHVDIPSRTLSNVKYSPRKRIIEMGKNTNRRELFNLNQAKAYMQTMLVANGCKELN